MEISTYAVKLKLVKKKKQVFSFIISKYITHKIQTVLNFVFHPKVFFINNIYIFFYHTTKTKQFPCDRLEQIYDTISRVSQHSHINIIYTIIYVSAPATGQALCTCNNYIHIILYIIIYTHHISHYIMMLYVRNIIL